jgi:hypothetical protein
MHNSGRASVIKDADAKGQEIALLAFPPHVMVRSGSLEDEEAVVVRGQTLATASGFLELDSTRR